MYSAKVLEEHDTTHRYLKQTRYSKSLDHFNFSCTTTATSQNYQRNNNTLQNQKKNTTKNLLTSNSCDYCKDTSIDLLNFTTKQKCQNLVKSLSTHTPSENIQHIFKSNSMQILSPRIANNFDLIRNGCIQEDHEEKTRKEKEEQATIKRLIEMGEVSSECSTTSFIKKNKSPLTETLMMDFIALRKVRSATCLGDYVSSVMLSGTESLPNITSVVKSENVGYVDYSSSSSSTCTSERSGWVSSRSSSITSLETTKSSIGNGFLNGIEKRLQSLTTKNMKKYHRVHRGLYECFLN